MLRISKVRESRGGEWATKLQWLARGYVPDEAKGQQFWANSYCSRGPCTYFDLDSVVYDPEQAKVMLREIRRVYRENTIKNRKIREEKKKREEEWERKREEWEREEENFWSECHTAWQWVAQDRVPIIKRLDFWFRGPVRLFADSRERDWFIENCGFLPGDYGKSPCYFYCHISNTILDPARAWKLLAQYNQMVQGMELPPSLDVYNGRPWW